ncbi:integrase catalytic domain-containing protein [Nephila pilipes]|uniref:Integrase catalytic domain-containing protein n=1 Tax=Nephila pilipes TaxID=299642 RepID=A0A8X6MMS1_NEPPI|nr:integrase catalytic domain-containing protein [Nephila pilipes]
MLAEVSGLEPADSGKGKIQLLLGMDFFCEVIRGAPVRITKGSAHNWKPFVANGVTEIQENTDPLDWRHCDGKLNPADLITRGCDAEELLYSTHWFCGPPFLSLPEEKWPISKLPPSKTIEGQSERRSKIEISLHCATEKNENGREPV